MSYRGLFAVASFFAATHLAFAKVPQLTLEATCEQAVYIFVGEVASTRELAATSRQSAATFTVIRALKGRTDDKGAVVYFQPQSSVSPKFVRGTTYVVFAQPYKDGLVTVNGEGGAFEVRHGTVEDAVLMDGLGRIQLSQFENRIRECNSVK